MRAACLAPLMGNRWAMCRGPFIRLDILKTLCGHGPSSDILSIWIASICPRFVRAVICINFRRNMFLGQKATKLWIATSPKIVHLLPTSSVTRWQTGKLSNLDFDQILFFNFSVNFSQIGWHKKDKSWVMRTKTWFDEDKPLIWESNTLIIFYKGQCYFSPRPCPLFFQ